MGFAYILFLLLLGWVVAQWAFREPLPRIKKRKNSFVIEW